MAQFVTYTISSTNFEINAHDGTMNTLLGLLAKGDQNCYVPAEETKPQDIFGENVATVSSDANANEAQVRDPNSLPPGVVQTAAEKAAAERVAAAAEAQRKADEEAERLAEEERRRQEEIKNRKPGFGTKVVKWLSSFTAPDE